MNKNDTSFRDRPINIDEKGNRKWVYAKLPKGKWTNYRTIVGWFLLAFFVLAPIIRINDHPFMLLDIVNRKFIIFGAIFWAQDTFILSLLMLSFVLFIIVFTVTYGRIWCGWACPQTLFLEQIFRKVETIIEGTPAQRRKRDKAEMNFDKFWRKTLKHIIFIAIAITMTNVFLMWFTGPDKLMEIVSNPISEHSTGFFIMLFISGIFYWIYSHFREQICTMVCPYGRMQGVLLDNKSLIVAYDFKRGEPRGAKSEGDCIDCNRCLQVCPTGIDIKNGTQLECINCTACIDECNQVMDKIQKPRGLIRFDSIEGITTGKSTVWNTRNKAYTLVLVVLFSFFLYTLFSRPVLESTILRTPGTLFQEKSQDKISNIYNIKIVNKTYDDKTVSIRTIKPQGTINMAGKEIVIKKHGMFESVFVLDLNKSDLTGDRTEVTFGIYVANELIETYQVTFVGP